MSANPFALLDSAARGDRSAQAALADCALEMFNQSGDIQALLDGLCFARLAAAHGREDDEGKLFQMLARASRFLDRPDDAEMRTALAAEALARISRLADTGSEIAAAMMESIACCMTPEAVNQSKWVLEQMSEREGA